MRILFTAVPAVGHVLALFPLADAARAAGHEVAFLTGPSMESWFGSRTFFTAGPDFLTIWLENRRRVDADPAQVGPAMIEFFAGTRPDLVFDESLAHARAFAPDLIVADAADFVAVLLAAHLGVAWAAHSVGGPPVASLDAALQGRLQDQFSARGLTPTRRVALLDVFPDVLRTHEDGAPAADRLPLRPDPPDVRWGQGPPPALPLRVAGRPRVLVTLVTTGDDPAIGTKLALAAASAGAQVLVTAAPADVPTHPHVHALGLTPLPTLLPDTDVVIGSAGSGTLLTTLGAGVPMVLFPVVAEQPVTAARAARQGCAVVIDEPTAAGNALRQVSEEPSFRAAAEEVACAVRALPPPAEAVDALLERAAG